MENFQQRTKLMPSISADVADSHLHDLSPGIAALSPSGVLATNQGAQTGDPKLPAGQMHQPSSVRSSSPTTHRTPGSAGTLKPLLTSRPPLFCQSASTPAGYFECQGPPSASSPSQFAVLGSEKFHDAKTPLVNSSNHCRLLPRTAQKAYPNTHEPSFDFQQSCSYKPHCAEPMGSEELYENFRRASESRKPFTISQETLSSLNNIAYISPTSAHDSQDLVTEAFEGDISKQKFQHHERDDSDELPRARNPIHHDPDSPLDEAKTSRRPSKIGKLHRHDSPCQSGDEMQSSNPSSSSTPPPPPQSLISSESIISPLSDVPQEVKKTLGSPTTIGMSLKLPASRQSSRSSKKFPSSSPARPNPSLRTTMSLDTEVDGDSSARGSSESHPDLNHFPRGSMHTEGSKPYATPSIAEQSSMRTVQRAETLPSPRRVDEPQMIAPIDLAMLLQQQGNTLKSGPDEAFDDGPSANKILILDQRVFAQYSHARIKGALNLCIPTTLIKRPSYDVQKLSDTFANRPGEQDRFEAWRSSAAIVVYDAASWTLSEATSCVSILKKFVAADAAESRGSALNGTQSVTGTAHGAKDSVTNAPRNYARVMYVIKGGFNHFAKQCPQFVESASSSSSSSVETLNSSNSSLVTNSGLNHESLGGCMRNKTLTIDPPAAAPVAGGCIMPKTEHVANPFFSTIRQNMDLVGGVGQISIKLPQEYDPRTAMSVLPEWLFHASRSQDSGKAVAERFLVIEQAEQARMKRALTAKVSFDKIDRQDSIPQQAREGRKSGFSTRSNQAQDPASSSSSQISGSGIRDEVDVQIAGIEKGVKNRYKDILPYDHSRVRLAHSPQAGHHEPSKSRAQQRSSQSRSDHASVTKHYRCDYINASHIRPAHSSKHYIASQAPVPATFGDFWRSIWEQDVRMIVMLTAEAEGGRVKSHPYWLPGEYDGFRVSQTEQYQVLLEHRTRTNSSQHGLRMASKKASQLKPPLTAMAKSPPDHRPGAVRRHSTRTPHVDSSEFDWGPSSDRVIDQRGEGDHDAGKNYATIRKLMLSNINGVTIMPPREIIQIHYTAWPDFGAPAKPEDLLALVDLCDDFRAELALADSVESPDLGDANVAFDGRLTSAEKSSTSTRSTQRGVRPELIHCSAGCGRTGTFCTVDTVIEQLRAQKRYREDEVWGRTSKALSSSDRSAGSDSATLKSQNKSNDSDSSSSLGRKSGETSKTMESDSERQTSGPRSDVVKADKADSMAWLTDDSTDLIAATVADLRKQRLSMVQTLRQFVLCYESILEWCLT